MTALPIAIIDIDSRKAIGACNGPASDGSCPRADIGAAVPCAGRAISPAGDHAVQPMAVPAGATGCPVTSGWTLLRTPDILPGPEG